jgi:hypothetical protein
VRSGSEISGQQNDEISCVDRLAVLGRPPEYPHTSTVAIARAAANHIALAVRAHENAEAIRGIDAAAATLKSTLSGIAN